MPRDNRNLARGQLVLAAVARPDMQVPTLQATYRMKGCKAQRYLNMGAAVYRPSSFSWPLTCTVAACSGEMLFPGFANGSAAMSTAWFHCDATVCRNGCWQTGRSPGLAIDSVTASKALLLE